MADDVTLEKLRQELRVAHERIAELEAARGTPQSKGTGYGDFFDRHSAVMLIIDPATGRIVDANPAAELFYGCSRQQLLSFNIHDINTLEPTQIDRHLREARDRRFNVFEFEHRRANGSIVSVEVYSTPVDVDGRQLLLSIVHDRSEQKLAESALVEKGTILAESQSIAHVGSWVYDVAGDELEWSAETYRIFGMTEESEVSYSAFLAAIHPDDRERVDEAYRSSIEDRKEGYSIEHRVVRPVTGEVREVNEKCRHHRDKSGAVVRSLGIVQDITERKRIERSLRESEERFRALAENSADTIMRFDRELRYRYVNPSVKSLTGIAAHRFIGKTHRELGFPRELVDQLEDALESVWQTGAPRRLEFQLPNGRWIDWQLMAELTPSGEVAGVITSARDITDRRLAEEALEQRILTLTRPGDDDETITFEALFQLEEIQKIQDEFAAATGVASIITYPDGTPITKPIGFCRLCSEIIRGTEKGRQNCYRSDAEIGRMNPGAPIVQPCMSGGLWDAGAAISVGGRHIANWLIGQVRDETQSVESIREYARAIGADPQLAEEAFSEVTPMAREQFNRIANALYTFANKISLSAYQNVLQARFIEERREAEEELRRSEERYRNLTENAKDVIWQTDAAGRVTFVNHAVEAMLGYTVEEAKGKAVEEYLDGDSVLRTREAFFVSRERARSRGERQSSIECEVNYIHREGRRVPAEFRVTMILDEHGEVERLEGITRDLTRRREAEREQRALESQLRHAQRLESIGRLAGGVAHDFNNLLTGIIGNVSMVLDEPQLGNAARGMLEDVQIAADSAASLTRQLLAFGRKQVIRPKVLDVNEHLHYMNSMLMRLIGEDVQLVTRLAERPICIEVDPGQLEQVIVNIVINARDAMPRGGRVEIATESLERVARVVEGEGDFFAEPCVHLSIRDNGDGMSEEVRSKVFEPFFTTKGMEGTGLGLATVYGIVKQHGGHIEVESTLGQGTTFHLYFVEFVQEGQRKRSSARLDELQGGSERILLVEDEELVRRVAARTLRKLGYEVIVAASAEEAKQRVAAMSEPIELIVTDVVMPDSNGHELAGLLQAEHPEMRVLYTSGYTANIIERHGVIKENINFVAKPYTPKSLSIAVRRVLDGETESIDVLVNSVQ